MALDLINIILLIVYFLIVLLISYFSSKKESDEGYLIADRKVSWPMLVATISASYFGGGALVLITTWAFKFGISVIWVFLGAAIGFLLFILLAKKIKYLADKHKFYTISDYIYYKFNKRTGLLSSLIIFIYFFTWILLQFMAGGLILSYLMKVSYWVAVLITGGVILIYLLLAGFKAVVKTDFFQYFIMLIFGILILLIFKSNIKLAPEQLSLLEGSGGIGGIIAFLIMGIFITLLSGDTWQRIYSAKDLRTAKIGLFGSFVSVVIIGLVISFLGLIIKSTNPAIPAENALMVGFVNLLPASLLGIGLLMVFSSIMSTADTLIFVLAMIISKDVFSHFKRLKKHSLVNLTKISMIALTIIAIIISLLSSQIADLGLITASVIMIIGPTIFWSFFGNVKSNVAFYSILFGFLTFLSIILFFKFTEELVVLPFFVALIVFIFCQILCKK